MGWNWTNSRSLRRNARPVGHADAAAEVDVGVRRDLVDAAVASRAEDHGLGGERQDLARAHVVGDEADAPAVPDDEVGHQDLVIEVDALLDALLIERVEQDLSGAVLGVAGPRVAGAAEGALGDDAAGEPAERDAHVVELVHRRNGQLAHELGGVLVGQDSRCP